jgi:hypothetical protein
MHCSNETKVDTPIALIRQIIKDHHRGAITDVIMYKDFVSPDTILMEDDDITTDEEGNFATSYNKW